MTIPSLAAGGRTRARPTARREAVPRTLTGFVLMTPALALSLVFFVAPMVLLVVMSFRHWPLLGETSSAGFGNYERAFHDLAFGRALRFSVLFTVAYTPLVLALGYATAVMVRGTGKAVSVFRTSFFLPVVIGLTTAAYMTSVLLLPGTGLINIALETLGLTDGETAWFTSPTTAFWAVVGLTVWKSMGIDMILLMAGMQAVPNQLIEAAKVDGAGWWRREASIIFPLIRRPFVLCLLLEVSNAMLVFDQFYALTKGGPSGLTTSAVMHTYSVSFLRFDLGYGAALSTLITGIILAVALVQLKALRAASGELDQ